MLEQHDMRGEWIRYEVTVLDKQLGIAGHNPVVRAAARKAFIAGAASMFRLCMVNIASEPTAEKQQAAKQRVAEELQVLAIEAGN